MMDKDRIKGTMDDAAGRVKRQVGEWTGNPNTQAEGAAQQIKGKTEKVVGQVKDAVRDARERHEKQSDAEHDREHDRDYQDSRP
jgi:uncharacterized protein YjbJ (UPF0337 family)